MSTGDDGLSLRGLAQRLEALERENAALRREVEVLRGSGTRRGKEEESSISFDAEEGRVSRRWLLSKAGAAAVGTVAAGALMVRDMPEAEANHYGGDIQANKIDTHSVSADNAVTAGVALRGSTVSSGPAVEAINNGSANGVGLRAEGGPGFGGTGVVALGHDALVAVGNGLLGVGVRGRGGGFGVHGREGLLAGVAGDGYTFTAAGQTSTSPGVLGRGTDDGIGVLGESEGGKGVVGESKGGYGGHFGGGKAQVRLVPGSTAGRPTTGDHVKGELYMDSAATLFVCVANGNPGTWRRVTATPS